ncbi:hypothetical protein CASFOL_012962 [Castilleja foliolosa]|uniref:Uncharacterized protein n=1 Tax=Castilleja foliolosa TaxID=1961234 RepID=A0ABD3DJB7_9LAMI
MKVQVGLIKSCFYSYIICFFISLLARGATSIQSVKCPFNYLYHFGDDASDTGNSIRLLPFGPSLPAARLPYGTTNPGRPTGRWSNGLIEFDYTAAYLGLPNNVPYLLMNESTRDYGVIFSVARSPVLDPSFFTSRGIQIPPYVVPLSGQLSWFKSYLKTICSTPKDCADRLGNSLLFMGDNEANDIAYSLVQGKSIKEVTTYVPLVIGAMVEATREWIKMGARRIIIPGSAPLGCYPYILTVLPTNDSTAYDHLGCLKSVNNLIVSKNTAIQAEIVKLSLEFPTTQILYADIYTNVRTIIQQNYIAGRGDFTLKACCGIGGKYNYDSQRFCGDSGVPVCSNPNEYIYWDGIHYTQEAYNRYLKLIVLPTLLALKCTFI